jgi:hypothetical protein
MKNSYTRLFAPALLLAGAALSSGAQAQGKVGAGEDEALALRAAYDLALPSMAMPGAQAGAAALPAPAHSGSVYVIRKAVALHADSIVYVLERASDRAQAWVEVKDHDGAAANTANMVNAIGAKLLLSDAGDEITPAGTGHASARRR